MNTSLRLRTEKRPDSEVKCSLVITEGVVEIRTRGPVVGEPMLIFGIRLRKRILRLQQHFEQNVLDFVLIVVDAQILSGRLLGESGHMEFRPALLELSV